MYNGKVATLMAEALLQLPNLIRSDFGKEFQLRWLGPETAELFAELYVIGYMVKYKYMFILLMLPSCHSIVVMPTLAYISLRISCSSYLSA